VAHIKRRRFRFVLNRLKSRHTFPLDDSFTISPQKRTR
jgi:hypothetical protein